MKIMLISRTLIIILVICFQNIEGKMNFEQLVKAGKPVGKTCQRQTGCPIELIQNAKTKGEFPPVPELQCYFKCLFIAMGIIKNDKISEDALNAQMAIMLTEDLAERLKGMASVCIPEATSPNICEAAYQYTTCGYKYDSSLYFFP
ncbi:uncharacterized protein LOC122503814 [Leptopilina heterotoma]|uniref:uncharacterized protein LOC122503814 n=1 Tax=Leptopilina heterotoma TaxID=63436 RepID=UPI001CA84F27|nr:uncharacterized protein LOC122503814 [Leptopilina heterotoma]